MNGNGRFAAVGAAVATIAVLAACSGGQRDQAAPAMAATATYIADLSDPAGETMTMAITAKNDKIVAYATNGTNDDAYFLGSQSNGGQMHLMSIYGDVLTASYDGKNIEGEVTMNETNSLPMKFMASRVESPAGIYTTAIGTTRLTYVVRPNLSAVGVMDNSAPGDHKVTDAIMSNERTFQDSVRQMRLNRTASEAPRLDTATMEGEMGGQRFRATPVAGDTSL